MNKVLKIHPKDNVIVALKDLAKNDTITLENKQLQLISDIPGGILHAHFGMERQKLFWLLSR